MAAYRKLALNWCYLDCEVHPDRQGDAVRGARDGLAVKRSKVVRKVLLKSSIQGIRRYCRREFLC